MNEFEMVRLLRIAADMNPFADNKLAEMTVSQETDGLLEKDLEMVSAAGSSGMSYQQFMKLVHQRGYEN